MKQIWSDAWFLLLPAGLLAWQWWRSILRKRSIQALAASLGFHYLGDVLPPTFPLPSGPLSSISSFWNVIDGEPRGNRIIAFDCRFGSGKGSWNSTIIAVQNKNRDESLFKYETLQTEQIDGWTILWRPKDHPLFITRLTPTDELKAYLETL